MVAGVELEGTDGEEGLVRGVALLVGIEDGEELGVLGAVFGGDAEGTAGKGEGESVSVRAPVQLAELGGTYIMAERTSLVGITPCFSPSMGSEKRLKASLISASSWAVTLCSLASLDCRGFGALLTSATPPGRRFGGYSVETRKRKTEVSAGFVSSPWKASKGLGGGSRKCTTRASTYHGSTKGGEELD